MVEFDNLGHLPEVEARDRFQAALLDALPAIRCNDGAVAGRNR